MKKMFIFGILSLITAHCYAQKINKDLLNSTLRDIVADLQYQLQIMADEKNKQPTRNAACNFAKKLFLNNGDNYTYSVNGQIYYDSCEVEIINKYHPQYTYKNRTKTFLHRLTNIPTRFEIVDITHVYLSNPKKVNDDSYICTAHFGIKSQNVTHDCMHSIDLQYREVIIPIQIKELCGICYNCGELCVWLEDIRVTTISELPIEFKVKL
ncbi:MAG: hypothetical protein J5826_10145 [Bacteroidales bacterium]|nr:hypothetical protein [Bacteroidales bacterium]